MAFQDKKGSKSIELYINGTLNQYEQCPEHESENFLLRLISINDAEDLLFCYGDPDAQKIFNSDNCTSDFKYSSLGQMKACIEDWIFAYNHRYYIRYSIVDKRTSKTIGTIETIGDKHENERSEYEILRIDVRHEYENEENLAELLKTIDSIFYIISTDKFVTKAIPEATHRINALVANGYVPASTSDGENWEHYYMKSNPSINLANNQS